MVADVGQTLPFKIGDDQESSLLLLDTVVNGAVRHCVLLSLSNSQGQGRPHVQ